VFPPAPSPPPPAPSSRSTRVDITARTADGRAEIVFADDGAGVSPGNRARVFEPFFTTRRESGGTGLGLRIVRALVEAEKGTVTLADRTGGAAFVVTLPAGQVRGGAHASQTTRPPTRVARQAIVS